MDAQCTARPQARSDQRTLVWALHALLAVHCLSCTRTRPAAKWSLASNCCHARPCQCLGQCRDPNPEWKVVSSPSCAYQAPFTPYMMTLAIVLSEKPIQHKEGLFTSTNTPAFLSCGEKVVNKYLNTSSASFFDCHSSHPDPNPEVEFVHAVSAGGSVKFLPAE